MRLDPELNGIEAMEQIRIDSPATQVLILSSHTAGEFVRRALRAGASGYLSKDSAPSELKMALAAVMNGEIYVSSRVARHLVTGLDAAADDAKAPALGALTLREREILQLIAEGKSTRVIAHAVGVSIKTVTAQRAIIMKRLRIDSVAGLVVFAVRHGLVDPERSRHADRV